MEHIYKRGAQVFFIEIFFRIFSTQVDMIQNHDTFWQESQLLAHITSQRTSSSLSLQQTATSTRAQRSRASPQGAAPTCRTLGS